MRERRFLTVAALLVLLWAVTEGNDVRGQQPHQVGLVIRHGDGRVVTRCVEFGESEISGYEALARSGLNVVADFGSGLGATVCSIDGEGCPVEDCWCQCHGNPCVYWSYHHLVDGQWAYANQGANDHYVQHGDVDGWVWGAGDPASAPQPPVIPFEEICAPPSTPTPTSVPATATPLPPTATPLPVPEAWFRLDQNPIDAGTCTYVRWDTWYVSSAFLDGESVPLNGSRELCPASTVEMTLRVEGEHGEGSYDLTLGVVGVAATATRAPTSTPQPPSPTATSAPTLEASPTPSPSPSPSATSSPSPTASATATPSPTSTSTALPSPTSTASPLPTVTPVATPSPDSPRPVGYLVFGLLAGSLFLGLWWFTRKGG